MDLFLECLPFKTTREIFEFEKDPLDRLRLLRPKEKDYEINCPVSRPKVLVCHDMRGNYLSDRYVPLRKQSSSNLPDSQYNWNFFYNSQIRYISGSAYVDAFQIFSWNYIDIFCYFSHNLLSIPPISWINCCRLHGAKAFGTLITEWAEGTTYVSRLSIISFYQCS